MAWTDTLEKLKGALPWSKNEQPIVVSEYEAEPVSDQPLLVPAVSLYENEKEIVLEADVPGATADTTKVHFDGNIVQLTARASAHPDGRPLGAAELHDSAWYRRFQLPDHAEGHRATSSLKHGVLSVRVPKSKPPRSHHIPVRSA